MIADETNVRYIGGPTALIEVAGLRLLTDPTFDQGGSEYKTPFYTLRKLTGPSIKIEELGKIDYVLLSHDHHFDNLDNSGRSMLPNVDMVFTTTDGAARLGPNATGLANWECRSVQTKDGRTLQITGTPARHGPAGGDHGPVTGFVLNFSTETKGGVYISGDTVWYEGVEEVARRCDIKKIILFMGAARVKEAGPHHLTMTADEGILVANQFPQAKIIPVHFEGWAHFSESKNEIENKFKDAGLLDRLLWAEHVSQ